MMSIVRGRKAGNLRRFMVRCDRCGKDCNAQFVTAMAALLAGWRVGWERMPTEGSDDPIDVCPACLTDDEKLVEVKDDA